jgi:hypothetical protein
MGNENKRILWDLLVESGSFTGDYEGSLRRFNEEMKKVSYNMEGKDMVEMNKELLRRFMRKPMADENNVDEILERQMNERNGELSHYFKSVSETVNRRLGERRLRVEGESLGESALSDTLVKIPTRPRVSFSSDHVELLKGIREELKETNALLRELVERGREGKEHS